MLGVIGMEVLSVAKNRKIITMIVAILIAIGISGMIAIGSQSTSILTTQG